MTPDDPVTGAGENGPAIGSTASVSDLSASDDASFINGAAYTIDGGTLAWRGTNP